MANTTALKTYDAIGNREDLTDVIAVVARDEAPLFSSLAKVSASSTNHEWQTDALTTGSDNAAIEGADFSFAIPGARTRVQNYTQIFTKTLEVSETQRNVSVAGLEDEFAYQMEKKMKEIATDIEKALITGTGNSGASGTARRLKGALAFISSNITSGSATGVQLTETLYNDLLQKIYAAGGRPDTTYVNGYQKRKISAFATPNARYQEPGAAGELKTSVSIYESDFGKQRIELNPQMDADKVLCLQKDMWKVAVLRPLKSKEVPSVADSKRGAIVGELTLEARNELSSGKLISMATSA